MSGLAENQQSLGASSEPQTEVTHANEDNQQPLADRIRVVHYFDISNGVMRIGAGGWLFIFVWILTGGATMLLVASSFQNSHAMLIAGNPSLAWFCWVLTTIGYVSDYHNQALVWLAALYCVTELVEGFYRKSTLKTLLQD